MLDGIRALASLMVLAYHFGPHIIRTDASQFHFLVRFPRHGLEGVDLFFVLSGFLISSKLVNTRTAPRYFWNFFIGRIFRLCPLYYLTLACYAVALFALGSEAPKLGRLFERPLPLWPYWLYLQNWAMAFAGTYGAIWMAGSWSLAIEEQFYWVLPFVVRHVSDRRLLRIASVGMIVPTFLRCIEQWTRWMPGMANHVLLPMRLDSLSAGIIVMLLLRNHRQAVQQRARLLSCLGIAFAVLWFVSPSLPDSVSVRLEFLDATISACTFGLLLLNLLIAQKSWPARALSGKRLGVVGQMAYSTYLIHPIVLCIAFRAVRGLDPQLNGMNDLPCLALALVATMMLSFASWRWFEQPIREQKSRFCH